MGITKKRVIVLSSIVVVLLAILTFFLITKGVVRPLDGLNQNSRVYMEDVSYENGLISFSVTNKTFRRVACARYPYIQRYENGEWIYVPNEADRTESLFYADAFFADGFDRAERRFAVPSEAMIPGEYRLVSGAATRTGEEGLDLDFHGECYIVGYFTVSE